MDQFENDLRDALRESENQPSVAGRIMARVTASKKRTPVLRYRWLLAAAVVSVAAVLMSVPFLRSLISPETVYAIVETGALYRVTGGKTQVLGVGEKIGSGTPVRTDDGAGAVLKLPDGASIEMHAKSELSLEPVTDGVSIRLNDGSLSVTPAKQPTGNLYVQNRGVTVPVVATVFQSTAPVIAATKETAFPQETFEVVSIRRRVGGGGGGERGLTPNPNPSPCTMQMDPKRFAVLNVTPGQLLSLAYGSQNDTDSGCHYPMTELGLLSGLPDWARSESFDIEAVIPDGSPIYTPGKCCSAKLPTPRLEGMLRKMLADRFGLVLRRETKEMNVYVLSAAKGGPKLKPWKEGERANWGQVSSAGNYPGVLNYPPKHDYEPEQVVAAISGSRGSMAYLADQIRKIMGRPVLDRTSIPGDFNYEIVFAPQKLPAQIDAERTAIGRPLRPVMTKPSIFTALDEDLGLELRASKEKVEVLVVDHMERPSDN